MASTPDSISFLYCALVKPAPSAAFSAFTITRSAFSTSRSQPMESHKIDIPGLPTTSPTKMIRIWSGSLAWSGSLGGLVISFFLESAAMIFRLESESNADRSSSAAIVRRGFVNPLGNSPNPLGIRRIRWEYTGRLSLHRENNVQNIRKQPSGWRSTR
jgi:hypothetical protein